jgi:large subunit ribosomal protein L4
MKVNVYTKEGAETGREAELNDSIFAVEPNDTLIYEDVRGYLAHRRQGTAKTKGRSEVRGGGRKAYRQKGTGNARRGTMRSPLLKGGGTVFGPRPRKYNLKLNKKAKAFARKSALTYKAREEAVRVVEDFTFDAPKTREMAGVLNALSLAGKKVLLLTAQTDSTLYKSGRNIQKLTIMEASKPSTYEILHADVVIFTESAVSVLSSILDKSAEETAA